MLRSKSRSATSRSGPIPGDNSACHTSGQATFEVVWNPGLLANQLSIFCGVQTRENIAISQIMSSAWLSNVV
jgi:hypothetical protein